eukprot:GHVU01074713.1.p1 GENE.GHVU01074713.1~~GHVU01074713.1.p1  ORF type:complete len:360 (-),score=15.77 GHVU01074713.1:1443-2522(-)
MSFQHGVGAGSSGGFHILPSPPSDSVSKLAIHPSVGGRILIAAGSWDRTTTIWGVADGTGAGSLSSEMLLRLNDSAPVLCCCFPGGGGGEAGGGGGAASNVIVTGGCSCHVGYWDIVQKSLVKRFQHESPVCAISQIPDAGVGCVAAGSWLGGVRLWDPRQDAPLLELPAQGGVRALDVKLTDCLVVARDRSVAVFDLRQALAGPRYKCYSRLRQQGRCACLVPERNLFILGTTEGRCCVQPLDSSSTGSSFKSHRVEKTTPGAPINAVFPVNCVGQVPQSQSTLMFSAGSDGALKLWDLNQTKLFKQPVQGATPIVDAQFHNSGSLLAFAVSYDWHHMCEPQTREEINVYVARRGDIL